MHNFNESPLGKAIRKQRNDRGWTQRMLADAVGVTKQCISDIERGCRLPGANTLQKIEEHLDINLQALDPRHKCERCYGKELKD